MPSTYFLPDQAGIFGMPDYFKGIDTEIVHYAILESAALDPFEEKLDDARVRYSLSGTSQANILYAADAGHPMLEQLTRSRHNSEMSQ